MGIKASPKHEKTISNEKTSYMVYSYCIQHAYVTHLIRENISSCFNGHDVRVIVEHFICDWTMILTYGMVIWLVTK